jgi:hypothetical protein
MSSVHQRVKTLKEMIKDELSSFKALDEMDEFKKIYKDTKVITLITKK